VKSFWIRAALTLASSSAACALARSPLGLGDSGLKKRRINLRYYLAGFDLRIKIHEQLRDVPRDLAANLHVDHRIERARRGNRLSDAAAGYFCRLIIRSASIAEMANNDCNN